MNVLKAIPILASAVALGLLVAGPVSSQDQNQDMPMMNMGQGMMGMRHGMGGGMMGMGRGMMGMGQGMGMMGCGMGGMMGMGGNMATHIDGRMAFIKAELGITEAQKPAWDEFEKTMRDHFARMQTLHQAMRSTMMQNMGQPAKLTDTLDQRITMMETHLNEMKTVRAAAGKLYDALDTNQKAKADQIVMGMGCMM